MFEILSHISLIRRSVDPQVVALYFISYCSIFNDRSSPAFRADLVIIPHRFRLVNRFLKSFSNFFRGFFSIRLSAFNTLRLVRSSCILPRFRDSLDIIAHTFFLVKHFFRSFLSSLTLSMQYNKTARCLDELHNKPHTFRRAASLSPSA